MDWLMLVASLAGQQSALRIRVWRTLKAAGAVLLRDGVYIVPASSPGTKTLHEQRADIIAAGGSAYILPLSNLSAGDEASFLALFDRSEDYSGLQRAIDAFVATLPERTETDARRALRQLKRDLATLEAIDFFPGGARDRITAEVREAETALLRTFSPDEPASISVAIPKRDSADYHGRTWATRERLWVDRVASAWLIRRFIDPDAKFLWLARPSDCPRSAVGFDFDGADFTHVEDRVTYEVLIEAFGHANDAALLRLGSIVRALDIGGDRPPEAAGFEALLTGARERCGDDDELLAHVSLVLDDLYLAFSQPRPARNPTEA